MPAPELSTRSLRHLRNLNRKMGTSFTDEELHDIGSRLLSLSQVAANASVPETDDFLNEREREALDVLRKSNGPVQSVRQLARALGYRSSRSGQLILQSLFAKEFLVKKGGRFVLAEKRESERAHEPSI